jgi:hypothetical protein
MKRDHTAGTLDVPAAAFSEEIHECSTGVSWWRPVGIIQSKVEEEG